MTLAEDDAGPTETSHLVSINFIQTIQQMNMLARYASEVIVARPS